MNNNILEFLEAYKSLDELCKQMSQHDIGVSEYLKDMEEQLLGYKKVPGWENDYKKLKRMRWIRNSLVHDTNSFQDNLFAEEDIEWLKDFRSRMIECRDTLALLRQATTIHKNITNEKIIAPNDGSNEIPKSMGKGLFAVIMILVGIASVAVIFAIVTIVTYINILF